MTPQQQVFALIAGGAIFLAIIELIRRRMLREEYSWLWFATGFAIFVLVIWYDLLRDLSRLIGAKVVTTTLFLFALLFLILINIHYSIKISALTNQVKDLAQALAIHRALGDESAFPDQSPRSE
jgi:tellurite resistance protein TehA-like permease